MQTLNLNADGIRLFRFTAPKSDDAFRGSLPAAKAIALAQGNGRADFVAITDDSVWVGMAQKAPAGWPTQGTVELGGQQAAVVHADTEQMPKSKGRIATGVALTSLLGGALGYLGTKSPAVASVYASLSVLFMGMMESTGWSRRTVADEKQAASVAALQSAGFQEVTGAAVSLRMLTT